MLQDLEENLAVQALGGEEMGRAKRYSTLTKRIEALESAEQGRNVVMVWLDGGVVTFPDGRRISEEEFDRRCERDGVKVIKLTWA